eukprot:245162-Chlamydomonas_euryale.AAC.3
MRDAIRAKACTNELREEVVVSRRVRGPSTGWQSSCRWPVNCRPAAAHVRGLDGGEEVEGGRR